MIHLIFAVTRLLVSLTYIFLADIGGLLGSIFIQIFAVSSKSKFSAIAIQCVSAVQGHPRSMILVPIESAYATSY